MIRSSAGVLGSRVGAATNAGKRVSGVGERGTIGCRFRTALLLGLAPALALAHGPAAPAVSAPVPPAALDTTFPGHDPRLRWDGEGNLHVIYLADAPAGSGASIPEGGVLTYRRLGPHPAGPIAVSSAAIGTSARGETAPVLEILPGGVLVAAYPATLPGRWKSEIRVQRSTDGGTTWSAPVRPHPERLGAHTLLSSTVSGEGKLVLAWLDDRSGAMALYAAESADGAAFAPSRQLDDRTCECCGTTLARRHDGSLLLAYRDLAPGNVRDFKLLRSPAGIGGFAAPLPIADDGWVIAACPDTGARLAETAGGDLWAVWYTAAEGRPAGLYAAVAHGAGGRFGPKQPIATSTPALPTVRHPEIGALPDGRVAVLYEAVAKGGDEGLVARLRDPASGRFGPPRRLSGGGRYPRLAVDAQRAAVGWTCGAGSEARVVIADWKSLEGEPRGPRRCGGAGIVPPSSAHRH
jgi:hypothetical protein